MTRVPISRSRFSNPGTRPDSAKMRVGLPTRPRADNAVERAVVLTARNCIDVDDLPPEVGLAVPGAMIPSDVRRLDDVERDYRRGSCDP